MSDSSDEDYPNLKDAIDSTLFNDEMFKSTSTKKAKDVALKSNRYLTQNENQDVKVSLDMQLRVGDKISKIIEKQIKFVDVEPECRKSSDETVGGVRLFSDSTDFLTDKSDEVFVQTKKPKFKRKFDECSNKEERIKEACVDSEYILNGTDTKFWKSRRKPKIYRYKSDGSRVLKSLDE